MPSTYSTSLKLELIGNGEQTGTWGQTTNNNLGTLIEQAITGVGQLTLVGDTVLTSYNGLPDESRNAVLTFSGSLAAPANVVTPAVEKTYIVTNNSGANVTIKTASGTGVTVANGLSALIYCDGADFYTAVNVNNVIGNLTVSGNEVIGGAIYLGNSTVSGAAGNLTMTANASIIDMSTNTGAFIPPTGTIAQRPASPTIGMSRWNSESGVYEIWNGLNWQIIASGSYSASYLIVAGGGGGGGGGGGSGGGGAGGLLSGTQALTPGTTYSFTIGSGGNGGSAGSQGTSGANSTGFSLTAIGGGGGGSYGGTQSGLSGGSGGGANNSSPGSGTGGQGYAGGNGYAANNNGGGGGGSSSIGGAASSVSGGTGGSGTSSSITGTAITYAAGAPGSSNNGSSGSTGTSGSGNGGGGGGSGSSGYSGGSGAVIISVPTTNYSGTTSGSPTITAYGAYTVIKFTSSGSYTA